MMLGRPRILVAESRRFSPVAAAILREFGELTLEELNREQLIKQLSDIHILWVRLRNQIDSQVIASSPSLRVIATNTTGLTHIDLDAAEQFGIRVVSLRGETDFLREIRATAELTIGLALALIRRLPAAVRHVHDGSWDRDHFCGTELYGKTVGIVGMGRLGRVVAGYFLAFGMQIIAYDPFASFPKELGRSVPELSDLLSQADLISLHVAYSSESHHLINRNNLTYVKPSAFLINTSRGGVVDEAAILEALAARRLAGAGLDVLASEPNVNACNPMVAYAKSHDNLIITPHIGGNTIESLEKTEIFLAEKLRASWQSVR